MERSSTEPTPDHCVVITPNLTEAERFLLLLAEDAEQFTFQSFDDCKTRKDPKLTRVLHGTLKQYAAELTRLNEYGAGIFVMVQRGDGQAVVWRGRL